MTTSHSLHQPLHLAQPDWYVVFVALLHPASRRSETFLETPVSMCCLRIFCKRLVAGFLALAADASGPLDLLGDLCDWEEVGESLSAIPSEPETMLGSATKVLQL